MSETEIQTQQEDKSSSFWSDFKKAVAVCVILWLLLLSGVAIYKSRNELDIGEESLKEFSKRLGKFSSYSDTEGQDFLSSSRMNGTSESSPGGRFSLVLENGKIIKGYEAVAAYIKANIDPDKFKEDYEKIFYDYYCPADSPDFDRRSREKGKQLEVQARRNLAVIKMIANVLQSPAGKRVTHILMDNTVKAVNSPSAPLIERGFELWRAGQKKRALELFESADKKDGKTHYVQIVSHHAKAFLKTEMRKPLEDIMEEYFELGRESQKYFKNFRPVLTDLGYDPKTLYKNGDPFESKKKFPSTKRLNEVIRDPWKEIMTAAMPEMKKLDQKAQKHINVLESFFGKNGELLKSGNINMKPSDVPVLMQTLRDIEDLNRPLFKALGQNMPSTEPVSEPKRRDIEIFGRKQQAEFDKKYKIRN